MAIRNQLPSSNVSMQDIRDTLNANGGSVTNHLVSFFADGTTDIPVELSPYQATLTDSASATQVTASIPYFNNALQGSTIRTGTRISLHFQSAHSSLSGLTITYGSGSSTGSKAVSMNGRTIAADSWQHFLFDGTAWVLQANTFRPNANLNKWSKWKPIRDDSLEPITDATARQRKRGLTLTNISLQSYVSSCQNYPTSYTRRTWPYNRPEIGLNPLRLSDFAGYDPHALPLFDLDNANKGIWYDSQNSQLRVDVHRDDQSTGGLVASDLYITSDLARLGFAIVPLNQDSFAIRKLVILSNKLLSDADGQQLTLTATDLESGLYVFLPFIVTGIAATSTPTVYNAPITTTILNRFTNILPLEDGIRDFQVSNGEEYPIDNLHIFKWTDTVNQTTTELLSFIKNSYYTTYPSELRFTGYHYQVNLDRMLFGANTVWHFGGLDTNKSNRLSNWEFFLSFKIDMSTVTTSTRNLRIFSFWDTDGDTISVYLMARKANSSSQTLILDGAGIEYHESGSSEEDSFYQGSVSFDMTNAATYRPCLVISTQGNTLNIEVSDTTDPTAPWEDINRSSTRYRSLAFSAYTSELSPIEFWLGAHHGANTIGGSMNGIRSTNIRLREVSRRG